MVRPVKSEDTPKKKGRPDEYIPKYDKIVEELTRLGATDERIAIALGFSRTTVHNWKEKHPSFFEAIQRGKLEADLAVVNLGLYRLAIGYTRHYQMGLKLKRVTIKYDKKGKKLSEVHEEYVEKVWVEEEVGPNATACIFWLKNRAPAEWRDVQRFDVKHEAQQQSAEEGVKFESADDLLKELQNRGCVIIDGTFEVVNGPKALPVSKANGKLN